MRRRRRLTLVVALFLAALVAMRAGFFVTAAEQTVVIEGLRTAIQQDYVDVTRTNAIDRELAGWKPRFPRIAPLFGMSLTDELRNIAHDRHLRVSYTPFAPSPPAAFDFHRELERESADNFGFSRVEVLEGNVGYVELRRFCDPDLGAAALASVMTRLRDTRAMILDLRRNHGGYAAMGVRLASYFFKRPVQWVNFESRNGVERVWTLANVEGPRQLGKPLYILTSAHTFSAGEGFAFHMQALKRAIVIGERTAGGANPGYRKRVGRHFWMFVPTARAVSPVTGGNWEGSGVRPDIAVPASEALSVALGLPQT